MTGWRTVQLGDEIELSYGKSLPSDLRKDGDFLVYGSNGTVGKHSEPLIDGPGIIIGRKGSVGEVHYSSSPFWPIDTTYYIINKANNCWRFLYHFLRSVNLTKLNSHSTIPGLNRDNVYSITTSLPDTDEQERIATVLDFIERKRAEEELLLQTLLNLKHAAMRELFTRGLRGAAQKETEIGLVPENWEILPLGGIALLERGRFLYRPRNEPRFYGGKTPFVQTGDVVKSGGRIKTYTQSLNEEGVAISRVFPKGTILITIAANIGYTGILDFDSACPDSLIAITPQTDIDSRYLEYFLQTQQSEMDRRAPKGTQKNINIQFLMPWLIATPSLPEQQEIVEILDAIDRKIELHKKKKSLLEELFKSLLHKLMTGEIRVADLDLSAIGKTAD